MEQLQADFQCLKEELENFKSMTTSLVKTLQTHQDSRGRPHTAWGGPLENLDRIVADINQLYYN